MFNLITGTIKEVHENMLTVVTAGIGFAIFVPKVEIFSIGQEVQLYVYFNWNQEQGPSLFGFGKQLEKTVFMLIISCSGIGPRIALSLLSHMTPEAFIQAVSNGNEKALSSVSGIGAKKAEQMIVHLKHKVAKLVESGIDLSSMQSVQERHNIAAVLQSLNYSKQEISAALAHVHKNSSDGSASFDQLLRQALSFLAKKA